MFPFWIIILTNDVIKFLSSHLCCDSSSSRNILFPLISEKHLTRNLIITSIKRTTAYFIKLRRKHFSYSVSVLKTYLKLDFGCPGVDWRTDHSDVIGFPFSSEHLLSGEVFEHEKHSNILLVWLQIRQSIDRNKPVNIINNVKWNSIGNMFDFGILLRLVEKR